MHGIMPPSAVLDLPQPALQLVPTRENAAHHLQSVDSTRSKSRSQTGNRTALAPGAAMGVATASALLALTSAALRLALQFVEDSFVSGLHSRVSASTLPGLLLSLNTHDFATAAIQRRRPLRVFDVDRDGRRRDSTRTAERIAARSTFDDVRAVPQQRRSAKPRLEELPCGVSNIESSGPRHRHGHHLARLWTASTVRYRPHAAKATPPPPNETCRPCADPGNDATCTSRAPRSFELYTTHCASGEKCGSSLTVLRIRWQRCPSGPA